MALIVERPQTLLLLLRDQDQLHRALDQAGVPADGRTVSFHLASSPQPTQAGSDTSRGGSQTDYGQTGFNQMGTNAGTSHGGQNQHGQSASGRSAMRPGGEDTLALAAGPIVPGWRRAGVDITA